MSRTTHDDPDLVALPRTCEHGHPFGMVAVRAGSTVYLPECHTRSGAMLPHLIEKGASRGRR